MSEPFIGQIQPFGFNFAPRGWAFCNGQLLPIAQNTALFSLLGTTYGGDGRTTFGLPDLRGRAALHYGQGPGLSDRRLGQRSGTETNTLQVANLAAHTHKAQVSSALGNTDVATGHYLAQTPEDNYHSTTDGSMGGTSASTGNNQAVNNMQPYLTINVCIALTGIFPSRS
jgi:microcystin-dependent protein